MESTLPEFDAVWCKTMYFQSCSASAGCQERAVEGSVSGVGTASTTELVPCGLMNPRVGSAGGMNGTATSVGLPNGRNAAGT
jgi:hypothetical protein